MSMETDSIAHSAPYPAEFAVDPPEHIANWRPLVQWLLLLPHLIILAALGRVANLVSIISWLSIIFSGRLPSELANFQIMHLRYTRRVFAYWFFLHDTYPPFVYDMSITDPGGAPVTTEISPELENRNRFTVFIRLIYLLPAIVFTVIVWIVARFGYIIAFFTVLVTGR